MLESIRKMWRIPDLRNKILYTLGMLLLFRLVGVIPAPGVDAAKVFNSTASDLPLLQLVNMMTGSNFANMTIMAMGITPYINASIIMQLLTIAIPALERMQKDEEGGREKIARITAMSPSAWPRCRRSVWWPVWATSSPAGSITLWLASAWPAALRWRCGSVSASPRRASAMVSVC